MRRIEGKENILKLLYEFDDVFPHNIEKISNYEDWASKISNNGIACVITDDNKNVGMAVFYANDSNTKKGYISLIGIKSDYRGRGLGKAFLIEIINEMIKLGMSIVLLEVDDDNTSALKFYKRFGFELEHQRTHTKLLKYIF